MCVCTIRQHTSPMPNFVAPRRQNRTWKVFSASVDAAPTRATAKPDLLKSRLVPFVAPNELRTCFERINHRLQRYAPLALKVIVAQAVESQFVLVVRFQHDRE